MITRRQSCQVIAATVAASLVPFDVMAETEESVSAWAAKVALEYEEWIRSHPHDWKTPRPGHIEAWHARCRARQAEVMPIASELFPGYKPSYCYGSSDGQPTVAYMSDDGDRRLWCGKFRVPWLASEDDLRVMIARHRPWDYGAVYGDAYSVTWVPGGEP